MFEIKFTGHETQARKILLEKKLCKPEQLAVMSIADVENQINERFECFLVGEKCEDWLLIPKDKAEVFGKIAQWIER